MVNGTLFREMREFGQSGQDVAVRWRHFEGAANGFPFGTPRVV
jgi:hypothetical protein